MPTIDQLAEATASSDSDELLVSQNGIARKVSRSKVIAGLQQQIAISSGVLLGRSTAGTGEPEAVAVGGNLKLENGALSALPAPYPVSELPTGSTPAAADLVAVGQSGGNAAVSYASFMSGISGVPIDASQMSVTPTGSNTPATLASLAANVLPLDGGQLRGPLFLASDPQQDLQAATKRYIDVQTAAALPKSGGLLTGDLTLASDPIQPLQPATKHYVDSQVGTLLPKSGGALSGSLTLAADPAQALHAATKQYVDAQTANALSVSGGTLTGPLQLPADPVAPLQATTKQYVDGISAGLLPTTGGVLKGVLTLVGDPAQPLQPATKQYVDTRVQRSGDVMTGPLILPTDPTQAMQAATKNYVDASVAATGVINIKTPPYGAKLDGKTDDTAAFKAAYQNAPANTVIYVPAGVANIQSPNSWGIPISKKVKWIVDGTTLPDGTPLSSGIPAGSGPATVFLPGIVTGNSSVAAEFSQTGSSSTDFAVLHSSYIVGHNGGPTGGVVATNSRNDTIIYNSPNNYIWGGLDRLQWNGVQTPDPNNPAQHVARYIQAIRATAGTDGTGAVLPQPQVWATCVQYVDQTGLPTSKTNAAQGMELDFHANGLDDMNGGDGGRYLASFALLQNDTTGAPVEAGNGLLVTLIAGHQGSFKRAIRVAAPFSQAALCTRWSQQLSGGHAIWLASGHHIALSTDGTSYLTYDQPTGTLRAVRSGQSNPIGVGLSLGWQTVVTSTVTLDPRTVGNMVFCVNTSAVAVYLPPVAQVPAGTGWMITNVGSADVTIQPTTGERIDNGPVVLHPNDRYCIVSDQWQGWKEVFRTNWANPRYSAPITLPNYTVANLPSGQMAGAKAFATNGRKPGEAAGSGTGVEVFFDGSRWISVCGGSQVQA